ncbi:tRNA-dihydrouridine synthase C [Escherichia coli]|uniref:tRNA-dihydrouridine synthase C n=1 Tax=Escherichia coli TaxID=562 RepID=A0A376U6T8_ECOLX|nr:tRNA-dihydrouridine synthase C [Escherichia coli]
MRVLLAPMEGVLDSLVRELLTEVNDYDLCITEFVRVVDQLLPVKVFHRICPELQNASRTPSGTLVRVAVVRSVPTMAGRERRPCGGVRFLGRGSQLRLPVENG